MSSQKQGKSSPGRQTRKGTNKKSSKKKSGTNGPKRRRSKSKKSQDYDSDVGSPGRVGKSNKGRAYFEGEKSKIRDEIASVRMERGNVGGQDIQSQKDKEIKTLLGEKQNLESQLKQEQENNRKLTANQKQLTKENKKHEETIKNLEKHEETIKKHEETIKNLKKHEETIKNLEKKLKDALSLSKPAKFCTSCGANTQNPNQTKVVTKTFTMNQQPPKANRVGTKSNEATTVVTKTFTMDQQSNGKTPTVRKETVTRKTGPNNTTVVTKTFTTKQQPKVTENNFVVKQLKPSTSQISGEPTPAQKAIASLGAPRRKAKRRASASMANRMAMFSSATSDPPPQRPSPRARRATSIKQKSSTQSGPSSSGPVRAAPTKPPAFQRNATCPVRGPPKRPVPGKPVVTTELFSNGSMIVKQIPMGANGPVVVKTITQTRVGGGGGWGKLNTKKVLNTRTEDEVKKAEANRKKPMSKARQICMVTDVFEASAKKRGLPSLSETGDGNSNKCWCQTCSKICDAFTGYKCVCGHFKPAHTDTIPVDQIPKKSTTSYTITSKSSNNAPVTTTFTQVNLPPQLRPSMTAPMGTRGLTRSSTAPSGIVRARKAGGLKQRGGRNYMTLGRTQSQSMSGRSTRAPIKRRPSAFALNSPAAGILAWARSIADPLGVNIKNLTSSWQDGRAFAAIVEPWAPDKINVAEMGAGRDHSLENLTLALQVARDLGVEIFVDAEDVQLYQDKKCIMLQLSNHRNTLSKLPKVERDIKIDEG